MHIKSKKYTDPIFYENEVITNKLAVRSSMIMSVFVFIFGVLGLSGIFDGMHPHACIVFMILAEIMAFACLIMKLVKYDRPWVKRIIIHIVIIFSMVVHLIYPQTTMFLIFGPILVSIMYYDRTFTNHVAVLSWIAFMLTVTANLYLDKNYPAVYNFHDAADATVWHYPREVLFYDVLPKTVDLIIATFVANFVARNGERLIIKRVEATESVSETKAQLNAAADIQMRAMPDTQFVSQNRNMNISAFLHPAKETGGDFFDYFMVNENLLVTLVADVSDKGLPSAMYVMKVQSILKYAIFSDLKDSSSGTECINLEKAVNMVNDSITADNRDDIFITLWIGCFDCRTGVGKYINAGHCRPIIRNKSGQLRYVENDPQLFIGVFDGLELKSEVIRLEDGDSLILYTDGVTDARNNEDVAFEKSGIEASLEGFVAIGESTADTITSRLIESLNGHICGAEQFDDITVLTLNYTGNNEPLTKKLTFSTERDDCESVINAVNEILDKYDCPEDERRNIDVLIDDECSNIFDYAYEGRNGEFYVVCRCDSNYINLEFHDDGDRFNPLEIDEPEFSDIPCYGGLGIHLIRNIADKVTYRYENGENILSVTKVWNI